MYKTLLFLIVLVFLGCDQQSANNTGLFRLDYSPPFYYHILSDSIPTLEQFIVEDGVYSISLNGPLDLRGRKVTVSCQLNISSNAIIKNGTLIGVNGQISASSQRVFENVEIAGYWKKTRGYMNWFTDGLDSRNNFKALTSLIQLNAAVELDTIYRLNADKSFKTSNDIYVFSQDSVNGGFILENSLGNKVGYFSSPHGNNIHLENINLSAIEVESKNKKSKEFTFASCFSLSGELANTDFDRFKLINCDIDGPISFSYSIDKNIKDVEIFSSLGIREIIVKDCRIKNVESLITLKDAPYRIVVISDNFLENISGPVFFFPINRIGLRDSKVAYDLRKKLVVKNNTVRNHEVERNSNYSYISLIVAKGRNFIVRNNKINNVISNISDCETYPFYCSASELLKVERNEIKNVFNVVSSRGFSKVRENTLLKLKGSLNAVVTNNEFLIDEEGLKKAGVFEESVMDINSDLFRINLFSASGKSSAQSNKYIFRKNLFITPYLNDYSTIARESFIFEHNTIEIGYLGNPPNDRWGDVGHNLKNTLFYLRGRFNDEEILFSKNNIQIDHPNNLLLRVTYHSTLNIEYNKVRVDSNRIKISGGAKFATPKVKETSSF